ncbi:hypothetical protein GDO81_029240, partial [Engystomops pustulosus]
AGDPADTDYTAVGCAVTTISSNLTEMSRGVKLLAALMEDEGGNGRQLLHAAKNLAGAVSELLKTAQPASTEPRQVLLQAAGNVGQTSGELLQQIGECDTDPRFQVNVQMFLLVKICQSFYKYKLPNITEVLVVIRQFPSP